MKIKRDFNPRISCRTDSIHFIWNSLRFELHWIRKTIRWNAMIFADLLRNGIVINKCLVEKQFSFDCRQFFFVHLNTTNLWKHYAVLPRQECFCLCAVLYQFALLTLSISFTLITGPNMYVIIKVDAVKFISLKAISKEQSESEFSSINRSDTSQLEFSFFQSVQWQSQTVSKINYWCIYT